MEILNPYWFKHIQASAKVAPIKSNEDLSWINENLIEVPANAMDDVMDITVATTEESKYVFDDGSIEF